jgi:predicted RND superfamily exporter protein
MLNQVLLYAGSAFIAFWGTAHLFPTRSVVAGFGDISVDNKRIITMEWLVEGVALIFIGAINAIVTAIDFTSSNSLAVYLSSAVALVALALVSFFTGFKINFLPYKLCPIIFIISAVLIVLGALL